MSAIANETSTVQMMTTMSPASVMTPHANMSTAAVELTTSVINNSVEFTSTLADFNATTASMLSTSAVVTTQAPPPAVEGRCLNILYEDIGESRLVDQFLGLYILTEYLTLNFICCSLLSATNSGPFCLMLEVILSKFCVSDIPFTICKIDLLLDRFLILFENMSTYSCLLLKYYILLVYQPKLANLLSITLIPKFLFSKATKRVF